MTKLWVTIVVAFVGAFSFARVGDFSVERSAYVAAGVTTIAITMHRLVVLVILAARKSP